MKKRVTWVVLAASLGLSFTFFQTDDRLAESVKRGESIYQANCMSCHMAEGEGLEGVFPPLANTGRLTDKARLVQIVVNGLQGPLTVKGQEYNSEMFPMNLNDKEIADVLNYVRNSWKNKALIIEEGEVKKLREPVK